jgi:hypothetical protein
LDLLFGKSYTIHLEYSNILPIQDGPPDPLYLDGLGFLSAYGFALGHCKNKTVKMLRRKSEFFVFMDSVRSSRSEPVEEDKLQLSPFDEYLQVLLDMKITSNVSRKQRKHHLILN